MAAEQVQLTGKEPGEASKTQYDLHFGPKKDPRQVCLVVQSFLLITLPLHFQ